MWCDQFCDGCSCRQPPGTWGGQGRDAPGQRKGPCSPGVLGHSQRGLKQGFIPSHRWFSEKEVKGRAACHMAESEAQAGNYDNMVKMVEDLNKDLEKLLEEIEKLTVQATWMAYDMVVMRTNPHLANSMRHLEDAFLSCKEEMEKKWQEVLSESKALPLPCFCTTVKCIYIFSKKTFRVHKRHSCQENCPSILSTSFIFLQPRFI
ncbi:synaptonemal complex central element protein 3 [Patagioenas fasciata monilis]|uniref:Synaptonemal complex central element protein 3 n=1 Tax=Patagioenas fasciata monilis TaxID=372326 RepID=A0A1V4JB15_PATFA|nr:synaptonemal complex central element protein 3 [Patagioenas fasciata monilis]